jgi:SH3-like domain-containing protein
VIAATLSGDGSDAAPTSLARYDGTARLAALPLDTFDPAAAPTARAAPAPTEDASDTPAPDIRTITASRVNMREGPGTQYGVLGRLTLGDEVEVLSDPGTGWVRLRPLAGGPEGWMADFLVSDS